MNRLKQVLQQAGLSVAAIYENGQSLTIHVNHVKDFSDQQKQEVSEAVKVFRDDLICKLWTSKNAPYHLACFVISKAVK